MRKKLFASLAFALLAVVVVLSVFLLPVLADDDDDDDGPTADGVWCYTPNLADLQGIEFGEYAPPGKGFFAVTYGSEWTGTFSGTSKDTGMAVSHIPEGVLYPGFPMLFVGTVSFDSVEVGGASGGLEMDVMGDRPDATSDWRGTWVITSGSGELEDLQWRGTWWGPGWLGDPAECGVIYYAVDGGRHRWRGSRHDD